MKLYWIKAQAPHRVLSLIKHLKLDVELIELDLMGGDLKTETYRQINPNMKVPTLVDGQKILWESAAIMTYLCIKFDSDMWPAHNPLEQVEMIRWMCWGDTHWAPAVSPFYFEHIVKATFGFGTPDIASLKEHVPSVLHLGKILDDHLKDKNFVALDRLTIADFMLASTATHWKKSEMPFEDFPNIVRWLDSLMLIPAWANPW